MLSLDSYWVDPVPNQNCAELSACVGSERLWAVTPTAQKASSLKLPTSFVEWGSDASSSSIGPAYARLGAASLDT